MKISEQDKEWIREMMRCEDYAKDIISYIENEKFDKVKE